MERNTMCFTYENSNMEPQSMTHAILKLSTVTGQKPVSLCICSHGYLFPIKALMRVQS